MELKKSQINKQEKHIRELFIATFQKVARLLSVSASFVKQAFYIRMQVTTLQRYAKNARGLPPRDPGSLNPVGFQSLLNLGDL